MIACSGMLVPGFGFQVTGLTGSIAGWWFAGSAVAVCCCCMLFLLRVRGFGLLVSDLTKPNIGCL